MLTVTSLVLTDEEPAEPISLSVVVFGQFNGEFTHIATVHYSHCHCALLAWPLCTSRMAIVHYSHGHCALVAWPLCTTRMDTVH